MLGTAASFIDSKIGFLPRRFLRGHDAVTQEAAHKTIEETSIIRLSVEDPHFIAEAIHLMLIILTEA